MKMSPLRQLAVLVACTLPLVIIAFSEPGAQWRPRFLILSSAAILVVAFLIPIILFLKSNEKNQKQLLKLIATELSLALFVGVTVSALLNSGPGNFEILKQAF